MAKQKDELLTAPAVSSENDSLEIIELASDDLELLARAFNLIAEVCAEEPDLDAADDADAEQLMH